MTYVKMGNKERKKERERERERGRGREKENNRENNSHNIYISLEYLNEKNTNMLKWSIIGLALLWFVVDIRRLILFSCHPITPSSQKRRPQNFVA